MQRALLSLHAMATRFELALYGDDPVRLRAAGEEALQEIERLDSQLSFYSASSEISWINARAAEGPVKIEPRLFQLLRECISVTPSTEGAFDVTVGPLMRAWRFFGREGRVPSRIELESAKSLVGSEHLELDSDLFTIRFRRRGVELDLGAYAKGYAIDRAMVLLRDNGVTAALLHGGNSSVCAMGAPPDACAWQIGLPLVFKSGESQATVSLRDSAMSVSALHGKSFIEGGRAYGHVVDPRTGESIEKNLAAGVEGASSAVCEALSTALLVNGPRWLPMMSERFPGYRGMIAHVGADSMVRTSGC